MQTDAHENFWDKLKSLTIADFDNQILKYCWNSDWNFWHNISLNKIASPEAARRYWSWNQLANIPWELPAICLYACPSLWI